MVPKCLGKSKELDSTTGRLRSSLVCDFLRDSIAKKNEFVNPEFCYCIDVFHGNVFSAPLKIESDMKLLRNSCHEINILWNNIN